MKRGFFFVLIVLAVVWAHERTATAVVPQTDARAHYSAALKVVASESTSDATNVAIANKHAAAAIAHGTKDKAERTVVGFSDYVLNMSDPASLTLLGLGLLGIVGISRRLPHYLQHREQSMIRIKNLLQAVSGFLF